MLHKAANAAGSMLVAVYEEGAPSFSCVMLKEPQIETLPPLAL